MLGKAIRLILAGFALVAADCGASPAAAAPPALEIYGSLPGFEDAAIANSGKLIAIVGRVGGQRMLVVAEVGGAPVLTFRFGEEDKIRSVSWAGDQAVLVDYSVTAPLPFGFTRDKAELSSVLVVPVDKSKPWAVFAKEHGITGGVRGRYGLVERQGRWFGYFGGITLQRTGSGDGYLPGGAVRPDLYEVDLQSQQVRHLAARSEGELTERRWLVDPRGQVAASLDWNHANGEWKVYNGSRSQIAAGKTTGDVVLKGLAPDGAGVVYVLTDSGGQNERRFVVPLAGGTPMPFLPGADVAGFYRNDAGRLVGYRDGAANGDAHFFDPAQEQTYRAIRRAFAGKTVVLESVSDDFRHLLVKVEGADDPGTWYRVAVAEHRADLIGTSYLLEPAQVGPTRMVPFRAADGLAMEGVLTLPPGGATKRLPAVVMPHGGPGTHDRIGFDWLAQAFASRGYAVFQPNFRGSTGYGAAFEQAGHGEWGRKMQSDLSDGLAELVKQGIVDPARVAIVGASYGGYAALAGVTLQTGLYRCAVAIAGIGDLQRMVSSEIAASDDPVLERALKLEIGSGRDLKAVSPIRFVDRVTVPVMLIHGKDDTVVDYAQSRDMASALRGAGKTVELVTLPGEDHWLSKGATRMAMLGAAVNFVLRHNPPDGAAAPAPANPAPNPAH